MTLVGTTQEFSDKIKSVEKDQIVSEKIKSGKGENLYYQYFLNSKSKSVIKLQYKKESGIVKITAIMPNKTYKNLQSNELVKTTEIKVGQIIP